jgi:alkylation response protein AidB-like acyl-CoA dehydrogenase
MSAVTAGPSEFLLDEPMLDRFRDRAPVYDRENRFFSEDFEELRGAGYLKIAVPESLGGHGRNLLEYSREVARLASYAPPTALATNMHVFWTGLAADLNKSGDHSFDWLLKEAAAGEVFANGHGERGNDLNGFTSTVDATRVEGGYRFTGHKIFGSLSPVWTRLAVWGMDSAHPDGPQMVHAFIQRDSPGYRIVDTWDTLGMRATRSDDTILEGVVAPDAYVVRVLPAGAADNFMLAAYTWIEVSFGAVYLGIAGRALALAVESAKKRTSIGLTRPMAYHPEIQHEVAEMVIALEAGSALVERTARDWVSGVDYGDQAFLKLLATKHFAVEAAQRVVDLALRTSGGTGMFKSNELERLYRDVRCGGFHPANSMFAHEIIAKTALGIDPGEQPRWG